jgi:hypothetical protein
MVPRSSSRAMSGAPRKVPAAKGSNVMNEKTGAAWSSWIAKNWRPSASQPAGGASMAA